uniref:22.5 kDa salivary protein n=1 Tax=Phlebotomus sergenti TaxID=85759 RepID=F6K8T1_9DIPT
MLRHIFSVGLIVILAHCAQLSSSAKTIPISKQGKNFPVPFVDPKETDDFFDDQYYPDIDDESITEIVRDNQGYQSKPSGDKSRPSATPNSGQRPPGRAETPPASPASSASPAPPCRNPGQQGRKQGKKGQKKQDLSRYKNSPAKYIFRTGNIDPGKTPDDVRLFSTSQPEYVIASGNPYDDYVVEIIEGPTSDLKLKQATIMGRESRLILDNPSRGKVIGRVKTYKA